jgi:nicotinate-nucleotide pyrophosphorylase (carboxylating)
VSLLFELPPTDDIVALALAEDLGVSPARFRRGVRPAEDGEAPLLRRDVTTSAVLPPDAAFFGRVVAREACVVCGLHVLAQVYEMLTDAAGTEPVEVFPLVAEGAGVKSGEPVAEVSGSALAVLAGERVALDFLMVLSGIATEARRWQDAAGDRTAVCDTRKTYPGLRALSKYAVRVGGGTNHRQGLWDMLLVKDNHIAAAGSLARAVALAREAEPELALEVEADTPGQAAEACRAGADMVLLDNMDGATLARAVAAVREAAEERGLPCLTEASGGVTFERLEGIAAAGVDRVSSSALTLTPPCDFGLDEGEAS